MGRDRTRAKKHRCRLCGAYGDTHIHHIFGGPFRKISERYNFVIELCPKCHREVHRNASMAEALKHDAQLEWLEEHSLEEWLEIIPRNWVSPDEVYNIYRCPEANDGPARFDDEEIQCQVR